MTAAIWSHREREAICALLDEVGPEAPTLCLGWNTRDLAAHLVVRERRSGSQAGKMNARLRNWAQRIQAEAAARPWPELISDLRSGPPLWSVFRIPGVDGLANTSEFFVHHEDIRRAQPRWVPRDLAPEFSDILWRTVAGPFSGFMFRKVAVGLLLHREDGPGGEKRPRPGQLSNVTISGPAQEILLYAFGRREHALVTVEGSAEAVAKLAAANLSI